MANAAKLVPEVKQVPLPANVYDLVKGHVAKGKVGTAFKGHSEVGMKVEDLLKKEKSL